MENWSPSEWVFVIAGVLTAAASFWSAIKSGQAKTVATEAVAAATEARVATVKVSAQVKDNHDQHNSRMDELLKATEIAAEAAGRAAGIVEGLRQAAEAVARAKADKLPGDLAAARAEGAAEARAALPQPQPE